LDTLQSRTLFALSFQSKQLEFDTNIDTGFIRNSVLGVSVRIKICGITSIVDAIAAIGAGADALGFMFYEKSPRFLSNEKAKEIIRELPSHVAKVGVFVDANVDTVNRTVETAGLDTLQFHGVESPDFCAKFQQNTIKAFRVKNHESLEQLSDYNTKALLLDSYVKGIPGGTGEKFNWNIAIEAKRLGKPIILAGGLTPDNASDAVNQVAPFGLDVSSGVESTPGIKEKSKMISLITNAKSSSISEGLWN
tara:strand:+ start:272 stop:1021 length:750 start_codon:yes stop_codon:yes gene_type:complete